MPVEHPIRYGWLTTALLAIVLFGLNFYVCREPLRVEYLRFMGSIEGAFMGLSRYAIAHPTDLTWFPLWNAGIPYQTTYPPLLPLVVALVASLRGTSTAYAYHGVTALAYCFGPVALFALTRRMTGSRWAGFAAGAIWSSVSMSAWLVPEIAADAVLFSCGRRFCGNGDNELAGSIRDRARRCSLHARAPRPRWMEMARPGVAGADRRSALLPGHALDAAIHHRRPPEECPNG